MNLSRSTVQTIVRNYNKNGTTENKTRKGRLKLLSRRDVSFIFKEVNRDPKISSPKLPEHIAKCYNKIVNQKTIRNALHYNGFRSRIRLEFAHAHIDKGTIFEIVLCLLMKVNLTFSEVMDDQKSGGNPIQHSILKI